MRICAIVLNYRDAAQTAACLDSLAGQGLAKVLLVDNSADVQASEELTVATRHLWGSGTDFDLHILVSADNFGFARGVNTALQSAHAENCDAWLLINNDAVAAPGAIGRLASAVASRPASVAVPTVVAADGPVQPGLWYQRFLGLMTQRPLPGSFLFPSGCCLMFGKPLAKEGRLFDEDFFMYGEDVLLGWRMMRMGVPLHHVDEAVVRHTGLSVARKNNWFYEYHTARGHFLLALKTRRSRLEVPLLLVAKSGAMLLRAAWRCLRQVSAVPLLAFLLAFLPLRVRPDHGKRAH